MYNRKQVKLKIGQSELYKLSQKKEKMKKIKKNPLNPETGFQYLWDNIKGSKIQVVGLPVRE